MDWLAVAPAPPVAPTDASASTEQRVTPRGRREYTRPLGRPVNAVVGQAAQSADRGKSFRCAGPVRVKSLDSRHSVRPIAAQAR